MSLSDTPPCNYYCLTVGQLECVIGGLKRKITESEACGNIDQKLRAKLELAESYKKTMLATLN